ncbi:serine protease AprX [Moorella thermoacetica]|uniref:Serine protease AprX n=1 Tax=Neomoorella thermoacetica TaxID=1525 RepID=A0A1J5JX74_NEOTH|nr:S8 family serine peptidase [Moorella thermoacetica]OIQ10024.1 serine protease AprX [Moorella thermoacetica]
MGKSLHNTRSATRILILILLLLIPILAGRPPALGIRGFLNDRAADIIGARPLAAPGLVVPEGLTGKGEIVGLADSGLDAGSVDDIHPDLQSTPGQMPKVVMLKSWAGREKADDPIGHGTHLAGIIAGSGAASGGQYRGIAPGASIYFQGLLDEEGALSPPGDLASLFRAAYDAGVRIHVDGWGGGPNAYRDVSAQIDAFVRQNPDFLPIFGAGNGGPVQGSLTAEANSKNALVIGASESVRPAFSPDANDAHRQADFSSRGPAGDGRLRPDLLAPGSALVSTRSRLVDSNFPANQQYTVMGGTSQAAAVAGGAAAVLRQYLRGNGFPDPPAALMKAALVNAAWTPQEGPTADFPGILDLAGTILALEEGTMHLADGNRGLGEGQEATFQFQVTDSGAPLRATLAWTDPAPAPGATTALVNDLDLTVIAPDGRTYAGNDFGGEGQPDRRNNLEKVYIKNPTPGTYTIKVKAAAVRKNALPGNPFLAQDFALAYGQPLERGVVAGATADGRVTLSDGRTITAPSGGIKNCVDGAIAPADAAYILPGADAYLGPRTLYIVARRWQAAGVQALATSGGALFLEINSQARTGGYYFNTAGSLALNGRPVGVADLQPGFDLAATINPSTGTLWQVRAGYQEKEGFLAYVNLAKRELRILGDDRSYSFSPRVAVTFADSLVEAAPADLPYGAADRADPSTLVPGMAVRLVLDPETGQVQYIAVKRELALGTIAGVKGDTLTLATGTDYTLFPGAPVRRDGREAGVADLQPGDWVILNLMPGSHQIIALTAYSNVTYGRVLYLSGDRHSLYLMDCTNQFRSYNLDDSTRVFRWGLPVSAATLSPGDWVRLTAVPGETTAWRVDAVSPAGEVDRVLAGVDGEKGLLRTADGSTYTLTSRTLVTLNGYRVAAADLPAWLPVSLTLLEGPERPILARVAASSFPGSQPPRLEVSVLQSAGEVVLKGTTSADRLYLQHDNGAQEVVPVGTGGSFQWRVPTGEKNVLLIALDRTTSGVTGQKLDLTSIQDEGFWDTRGHWAENDINKMAARGLVAGYEDGSFRPDNPVTRVELIAFLVRLAGWRVPAGSQPDFTDRQIIPDWARATVAVALERGLVSGYPDGSFRPGQVVSRVEAAAFFTRYLEIAGKLPSGSAPGASGLATSSSGTTAASNSASAGTAGPGSRSAGALSSSQPPPFTDWDSVPVWGREAVARAYAAGLMGGMAPGVFAPLSPLTRAQAAAIMARML